MALIVHFVLIAVSYWIWDYGLQKGTGYRWKVMILRLQWKKTVPPEFNESS